MHVHEILSENGFLLGFRSGDSDLWSKFFVQILNANGNPTVPLLRELREELRGTLDSSFPERLSDSLTKLAYLFNTENIFWHRLITLLMCLNFPASLPRAGTLCFSSFTSEYIRHWYDIHNPSSVLLKMLAGSLTLCTVNTCIVNICSHRTSVGLNLDITADECSVLITLWYRVHCSIKSFVIICHLVSEIDFEWLLMNEFSVATFSSCCNFGLAFCFEKACQLKLGMGYMKTRIPCLRW